MALEKGLDEAATAGDRTTLLIIHMQKITMYYTFFLRLLVFILVACSLAMIYFLYNSSTVEPRFHEVAGDRPNLFVKWRVRYIEVLFHTFYCNFGQDIEIISFVISDFVK